MVRLQAFAVGLQARPMIVYTPEQRLFKRPYYRPYQPSLRSLQKEMSIPNQMLYRASIMEIRYSANSFVKEPGRGLAFGAGHLIREQMPINVGLNWFDFKKHCDSVRLLSDLNGCKQFRTGHCRQYGPTLENLVFCFLSALTNAVRWRFKVLLAKTILT